MRIKTKIGAALLAAGAAVAFSAWAGGDKVAFPANYDKGVLYSVTDRYDTKQYRELYASKEVVDAARAGKPIPNGAVLTMVVSKAVVDDKGNPVKDANGRFKKGDLAFYAVMEKRSGWGAEYPADMRNGEWEYQTFQPDKTVNEKANLKSCFTCHKPHDKQDFVISLAKLNATFPSAKATAKTGPGTVAIAEFLFGPEKIEVAKGGKVTWTNTDDSPHQVTVTGSNVRSGVMLRGQSETLTFNDVGTFDYICGLHPNMKGKIEVK